MANVSTSGSYEQYKLDTNRFIFWLIETANKRGYDIADPANIQSSMSQQPSKRLKGKERKQARQATTSTSSIATSSAPKAKYIISTETIPKLAKHIADHKETSTIPKFVWYSCKRAIRTREAYANRYAQEELSDTTSNNGHTYFLGLLKYCHETLKAKIRVQAVGRTTTATPAQLRFSREAEPTATSIPHAIPTSVPEPVSSSQAILAEETAADEAEQEAAGHKLDELARKFEINMKAKHDALEGERHYKEDIALRKSCLADDMRTIIVQLESDWNDTHKAAGEVGFLDEIRATLMTEAAFDLIRRKEEALVQEAHEKHLPQFDPSLDQDKFFGKTARSLKKIEAERRRSPPGQYLFLVSRLETHQDATNMHSSDDYNFLVHYLFEAGLEPKVRKEHEQHFNMPLLAGALDAPSRMYGSLGTFELVSMVSIFAAELAIRIRSKDAAHSLKHYPPTSIRAAKEEALFASWHNQKINFPQNIWEVVESASTHRNYIIGRPFAQIRYTEMRILAPAHPLYGLQHDYPKLAFRAKEGRDVFMKNLEKIEDHPGDARMRQAYAAQYILPPQDGDFLRMKIPTLRAKLSLVHLLLREEMGLGFANLSPQIFAICHLYNCFQKRGLITGTWPEIELMMDWHLDKIFLNEVPSKAGEFYSRLLLAAGYATAFIKKARDPKKALSGRIDFGKATHKTCELDPLPMTKILRDYVHKRDIGGRTWYRMDEEMTKHTGNSSRAHDTSDLNILSFIKDLRNSEQLPRILPRLEFDYISLTLQCNELCQKIDVEQENLGGVRVHKEEDWKSPTGDGFMLVALLLGDLDRVHLKKEKNRKGSKHIADATDTVEAAVRVMQGFLDGLKR